METYHCEVTGFGSTDYESLALDVDFTADEIETANQQHQNTYGKNRISYESQCAAYGSDSNHVRPLCGRQQHQAIAGGQVLPQREFGTRSTRAQHIIIPMRSEHPKRM